MSTISKTRKVKSDLPIAIMPTTNQITLLQLDGQLNDEEFSKAFHWALDGCRHVYELQRQALIGKYFGSNGKSPESGEQ